MANHGGDLHLTLALGRLEVREELKDLYATADTPPCPEPAAAEVLSNELCHRRFLCHHQDFGEVILTRVPLPGLLLPGLQLVCKLLNRLGWLLTHLLHDLHNSQGLPRILVGPRHKGVCHTLVPCPASPTNPVDVVFSAVWQVIVDYALHTLHIQAPGCDVRRHQNGYGPCPELMQGLFSLTLVLVSMHGCRAQALPSEEVGDNITGLLAGHKYKDQVFVAKLRAQELEKLSVFGLPRIQEPQTLVNVRVGL
mmetsp:Transcript_54923/g.97799  ORF Transcript_54923/g.97799 Transcript_54923/m.97799 type:complete len:252 (+) Transcript_54923:254-1009(+)